MSTPHLAEGLDSPVKAANRLLSLDAFRGLTIIAMILVNTPGSWDHVYAPLLHAEWHGVTPTDYIFPFFIFIVGVSVVLSYNKMLGKGADRGKLIIKTIKRAAIIFAIGIFLGLFPDFNFSEIRIPGVLQRIALVFLACALLYLYTNWRQQALIGAILLLSYWGLMMLVPVPEYGAGVLEPGKNLAAWIDSMYIPGSMWQGTWDPEGILSTVPAIATGIAGMLAGRLFSDDSVPLSDKIQRLFVWGFIAFAIGSAWGWVFPINKNLWTSSYVLFTAGLAGMTWATLSYFMDVRGCVKWSGPAVAFGSNAITAYAIGSMLPSLIEPVNNWFVGAFIEGGSQPKAASMLWAILIILLCFIPIYILYKRKIFIKV